MMTSWRNSRGLVFALLLLYFSGVKGAITSPPQNIATKVGSQTYLNCSGNNGVPGWRYGELGNDITLVDLGTSCNVSSNYSSRYRSEATGSNTCNLIILNPSLQESGVYCCLDNNLTPKYAVLTVLDSVGTPTVSNASDVVEGDQLTLNCTVEYGTAPETPISSPIAPILSWTTSGINITNAVIVKTNVSVTSSITVVATRDGVPSYDCTAHFLPPANKPNSASNEPSNVYIGRTYPITGVYYGPTSPVVSRKIVNVTEIGAIVCSFIELTCNSSANPSPNYAWTDITTGNLVATGNVLAFAEDNRTYQCTASNKVNSSSATYTTGVSQPRQCVPAKTDNIRIYSVDGHCDNATNSCSCVNGSHVNLICEVTIAYPLPNITWVDGYGNVLSHTSSLKATMSGIYICRSSNQINLLTNTTAEKTTRVTDCYAEWKLIVSVIIPWIGECLIVTIIFLVCYASLAFPFRAMMLSRFPWLDYMLPCMKTPRLEPQRAAEKPPVQSSENPCPPEKSQKKKSNNGKETTETLDLSIESLDSSENCKTSASNEIQTVVTDIDAAPKWKKFVFAILLLVVSVTCGIVFFPILIIIACISPRSKETEPNISQICDTTNEGGAKNHGLRSVQDRFRPSQAKTDPSPYKDCRISIFPPSKTPPQENKELKPKPELMAPNYTVVNKTKSGVNVQESNAYSFTQSLYNDDRFAKAVPLPPIEVPHQRPAPNPNAPLYGEIILGSQSTSRRPVQYLAEGTDAQYAPLKNT